MKKFMLITSCLLLLAGTTALPVMAQEATAPPAIAPPATAEAPAPAPPPAAEGEAPGWIAHGSITGGGEYFWEDSGNAKFNEYRYKQSEPWGGFGGLNAYVISPDGSHRMDLSIDYRSPEDIDVDLTSQTFGLYKFDFGFQRMGHVFAYDAKSVFDGVGTGNLTLKPGLGLPLGDELGDAPVSGCSGEFRGPAPPARQARRGPRPGHVLAPGLKPRLHLGEPQRRPAIRRLIGLRGPGGDSRAHRLRHLHREGGAGICRQDLFRARQLLPLHLRQPYPVLNVGRIPSWLAWKGPPCPPATNTMT